MHEREHRCARASQASVGFSFSLLVVVGMVASCLPWKWSSTARSKCGLTSSSSYRRITTNRSLLWVTSSGSRVLHEGVARGAQGGGVQYDRLIDVLTVQCNSVAMEIDWLEFFEPCPFHR